MDFSFYSHRNSSLFILFSLFFIFNTYIYPFLHPTTVIVPVHVRSAFASSFHFDANLNKTNEVEVQVHELRSPNERDGAAEPGRRGRRRSEGLWDVGRVQEPLFQTRRDSREAAERQISLVSPTPFPLFSYLFPSLCELGSAPSCCRCSASQISWNCCIKARGPRCGRAAILLDLAKFS